MRNLANIDLKNGNNKTIRDLKEGITETKQIFGEDYLQKLERRVGDTKSEIIIAIENTSHQIQNCNVLCSILNFTFGKWYFTEKKSWIVQKYHPTITV